MKLLGSKLRNSTLICVFVVLIACAGVWAQSNWTVSHVASGGDLVAVYFTSDKTGWIAGDNGYLASTRDGGDS